MTSTWLNITEKFLQCAAVLVAHFAFVADVAAQEVTYRSENDAVTVAGRFVAFDGENVSVAADAGLITFRSDGMTCEGTGCPDLENYVASLRLVGASRMGDLLLPALVDVYARDSGLNVREDVQGFQLLRSDGTAVFKISISIEPQDQAFSTFVNHNADALLSMRELRDSELVTAADAGLGPLNFARHARILALDALVPVVSATSDVRSISMADLTAELAGTGGQFEVHFQADTEGQIQGFEDRFMRPFGLQLEQPGVAHENLESLLAAVAQGANGLSLVPFGSTQSTQPLALNGPCGLQAEARFLTMKTEDYPLTFPMFIYLPQRRQHPQVDDFLDWLRSPSAQLVIRRAGFVDLAAVPIPLGRQGDRLASAIANAGVEIQLEELQRMVRLLSPRVRMSSTFRFEPGSTRLDGQSRSNVMQLAQAIRDGRFGGRELMLVGFSDGRGPAAANRDLSFARAEAVLRDLSHALGGSFPANVQVETEAFGEALPMACDDTIWGQQTNRRVELWVRDAP
ncbi:phosphate ABC transporter substrate-binding/OmpA family protein [Octadecabacter ascidiaceicola]|uniref:OmpA family protein n=1 Tax=Octadecabacter ascidiaceicola TaxID=1655543 RepID=A0A238KEY3_9RHOB|nr:phosphate ABC transporter substrate-binding/OmpA family protein [Octadecabacter ascidiaceicola]SMX41360.1 OmpA family protein [Octadecabacter ascidiaceicola]